MAGTNLHGGAQRTGRRIALLRERDGGDCQICHKPIDWSLPPGQGSGPSVDHVIPLAAGGSDRPGNWQLAHAAPCNHRKGSFWNGRNYQRGKPGALTPSPYGIGKHYRRASLRRYNYDPPCDGSDWETPVMPCP